MPFPGTSPKPPIPLQDHEAPYNQKKKKKASLAGLQKAVISKGPATANVGKTGNTMNGGF